jgi:hypothetical protein
LPSSVVKSIIATANFSPASFELVLMLRFAKAAARSSAITWSTLANCDADILAGNDPVRSTSDLAVFPGGRLFIFALNLWTRAE